MKTAFEEFWRSLSRAGDPDRIPNKVQRGFYAGWNARAALEDRQEAEPDDFAMKFEECNRDRNQLFDECRRRGRDIQDLTEEIAMLRGPGVPSEATPSKENAPIYTETVSAFAVTGKFVQSAPAPEVQGTPQSVIRNPFDAGFQAAVEVGMHSTGAAKALADYRNWLWNQQGRATLSEQHAELLKRERAYE